MTSEGRKRKRSESPDAALSPAQLSTAQPEHPEQPERAEQPGYTDFDRVATAQDYTDVDLPSTAQAYKDVDHPTTRQAYEDVDLPTTPPDIPLVHTRARSTLSLIDEPTFPLTEEPTLPLTEESYLQRSALSPAQLSLARPESAEQPGFTDVQGYTDVDQPTTPPAVSSVHTPSEPTVPLTEAPHLHRSLQSPAQLSPTQLAYTDVDLPATPPAFSPVHSPVRSTLPLTQANLRAINPDMGPKKSVGTSAQSDSSVASGNSINDLRNLLRINGYVCDDRDARTRNRPFFDKVMSLVDGDRHSAMKPSSVERIDTSYMTTKDKNEDTFFLTFYPDLINKFRTFGSTIPGQVASPKVKTWVEDHILGVFNQVFIKDSIAVIPTSNAVQKKLVADYPDVAKPKPDLLYGLNNEAGWCSKDQFNIIDLNSVFTMPSKGLVLPYLIIEAKGSGGLLAEAELQALRGGAALNSSFRGLDAKAGSLFTKDGADDRSHVFSLIFDTENARFSVHWAEVKDGKVVKYHMHRLKYYTVAESDNWPNMRHDVDNVLDWGVVGRRTMILEILEKIVKQHGEGAGLEEEADEEEEVAQEVTGKKKGKGKGKGGAEPEESASSSAAASAPEEARRSGRNKDKK